MQHLDNLILNTDSYKASHWLQYPPGTDKTFFYVESRGGQYDRRHGRRETRSTCVDVHEPRIPPRRPLREPGNFAVS